MRLDDEEYKELLALCNAEDVPDDPAEARQAIENFVDLIDLLMRPLPLPLEEASKPMVRAAQESEMVKQVDDPRRSSGTA
jgi:hypothetical protein